MVDWSWRRIWPTKRRVFSGEKLKALSIPSISSLLERHSRPRPTPIWNIFGILSIIHNFINFIFARRWLLITSNSDFMETLPPSIFLTKFIHISPIWRLPRRFSMESNYFGSRYIPSFLLISTDEHFCIASMLLSTKSPVPFLIISRNWMSMIQREKRLSIGMESTHVKPWSSMNWPIRMFEREHLLKFSKSIFILLR